MSGKCIHDWQYTGEVRCSKPPAYMRICKKCDAREWYTPYGLESMEIVRIVAEILGRDDDFRGCSTCTLRCELHKCGDCLHYDTVECHYCEHKDLYTPK